MYFYLDSFVSSKKNACFVLIDVFVNFSDNDEVGDLKLLVLCCIVFQVMGMGRDVSLFQLDFEIRKIDSSDVPNFDADMNKKVENADKQLVRKEELVEWMMHTNRTTGHSPYLLIWNCYLFNLDRCCLVLSKLWVCYAHDH